MSRRQWLLFGISAIAASSGFVLWGALARWRADRSLAVAGIAVSVAGFSVAIQQIRTTRGASIAAAEAVTDTLGMIASLRVSALLPRLKHELEGLESAMETGNLEASRRALNEWRSAGLEVANALASRLDGEHEALKQLTVAREAALDAKTNLYNTEDIYGVTVAAFKEMEKACDELTIASNELLLQENDHG